ncbi:hypothetical protein JXI42_14075 [bacterium]|nr:hypothetical protein [bacterium]
MSKITFAVRIDDDTLNRVKNYCREHGVKYSFFVEKALEDKLEEEELRDDIMDFKTLRNEEEQAISMEDYLKLREKGL